VSAPLQPLGTTKITDLDYGALAASYLVPSAMHWDDAAHVPYLSFASASGAAQCTFVSYEDARSIADKVAFARNAGLGAIVVWRMAQGYVGGAPIGARQPLLAPLAAFIR
jgi:chitinase